MELSLRFKCFVIGNNSLENEILKEYIVTHPNLILIDSPIRTDEIVRQIKDQGTSIVFLNVDLEITGQDIADIVASNAIIIFTCRTYESTSLKKRDYLLPLDSLSPTLFNSIIVNCLSTSRGSYRVREFIFIQNDRGNFKKIKFSDILYVEAALNNVKFYTVNGMYHTHLLLKDVASLLPKQYFIRVHRSYLINFEKVSEVDGNYIYLGGVDKVSIGNSYKKDFYSMMKLNSI